MTSATRIRAAPILLRTSRIEGKVRVATHRKIINHSNGNSMIGLRVKVANRRRITKSLPMTSATSKSGPHSDENPEDQSESEGGKPQENYKILTYDKCYKN